MKSTRTATALGATLATAGLATLGTGVALALTSTSAQAAEGGTESVYVCKWKKTPDGELEEIKPGKNPIVTSVESIPNFDGTFPTQFGDAQTFSVALGFAGDGYPVITLADCLANPPVDPSPTVTVTTTVPTETETTTAPTETVTVTEPTETETTDTTPTGTSGPRPPGDPTATIITDPAPTSGNPKVTTDDPTPNDVPTAVAAGLGGPSGPVAGESATASAALTGAGGAMAVAGGLLLFGARRRGDETV